VTVVLCCRACTGSGRTDDIRKLATWLTGVAIALSLVSVDIYRPAAREQSQRIARPSQANCYEGEIHRGEHATVERAWQEALREAINTGSDVLIGRLPPAACTSTIN